jgi:hypothetical protein
LKNGGYFTAETSSCHWQASLRPFQLLKENDLRRFAICENDQGRIREEV